MFVWNIIDEKKNGRLVGWGVVQLTGSNIRAVVRRQNTGFEWKWKLEISNLMRKVKCAIFDGVSGIFNFLIGMKLIYYSVDCLS